MTNLGTLFITLKKWFQTRNLFRDMKFSSHDTITKFFEDLCAAFESTLRKVLHKS